MPSKQDKTTPCNTWSQNPTQFGGQALKILAKMAFLKFAEIGGFGKFGRGEKW